MIIKVKLLKKPVSLKISKAEIVARGSGNILIVDNEDVLRHMLMKMLENMGYHVLEAANGEDAIRLYRQRSESIHLVIMDLSMPKMGGEETFLHLKSINPSVKVIISSGFLEGEEIQGLIAKGVTGFLSKPYGVKDISSKIHQVLFGGEGR